MAEGVPDACNSTEEAEPNVSEIPNLQIYSNPEMQEQAEQGDHP